jgi:Family of unknown function (DUF6338)
MKFQTASDIYFIVAVFVPGFIFDAVISRFLPRHPSPIRELVLLRLLTASAFNYAVCSPLIYLLATGSLLPWSPVGQALVWLVIICLVPILLALVTAWASQKSFLASFAKRASLRSINPVPTGWDWIFGRTDPCYVLVTLRDGRQIAGFFGRQSMASSDRERKDLYLERAFLVPVEGPWQEVENSKGVYVDGAQISSIEFRG